MPVAFRVSAPLAMFRKWWTTTSSVSYAFPPPTAVAGLISAIMGFQNGEDNRALYWEKLTGGQVAIVIERFSYISMGVNFLNTKDSLFYKNHTQIMHQFLRNPSYIIFYKGPLEDRLYTHLKRQWFIYTPYLGVAYAITKPTLVGRWEEKDAFSDHVHSVFPFKDSPPPIDVVKTGGVFTEKMDYMQTVDRKRKDVLSVIYAKGPVYFKEDIQMSQVGSYRVKWFPQWV